MYVDERREHGSETKDADQHRVREPDRDGDTEHGEQAEDQPAAALALAGEEREDHDDETGQRPDREIDRARQQDDQLPERDQRERARQQQHRLEVELAEEQAVARGGVRAEAEDQHRQDERRQVVAGGEPPDAQRAAARVRRASSRLPPGGDRGARDVLLGDRVALELAHDLPAREDEHPVAKTLQLDDVGREDDDRLARIRGRAKELVDLEARAGVDAVGRLVRQQHVRLREQRTREENLLLVAARERRDGRLDGRRAHPEALHLLGRQARPRGRARSIPARATRPSARIDVFSRTVSGRKSPSTWRSPGRWTMPRRFALARVRLRDLLAAHPHVAARRQQARERRAGTRAGRCPRRLPGRRSRPGARRC